MCVCVCVCAYVSEKIISLKVVSNGRECSNVKDFSCNNHEQKCVKHTLTDRAKSIQRKYQSSNDKSNSPHPTVNKTHHSPSFTS